MAWKNTDRKLHKIWRRADKKYGSKSAMAVSMIAGYDAESAEKKTDISGESYLQTVVRRFKRHHLAAASLVVLGVIVLAALLAPVIAPYDPNDIVGPFAGAPSKEFWLGTDQIGRDVLSRLLYATRISLLVGVLATVISTVIGVILGLIAGYFGGVADMIIMRFTDIVMSFPYILLVLVAAAIFKPDRPYRNGSAVLWLTSFSFTG